MIYHNNNIKNKKITILGAGISGFGATKLANYKKAKVFLSNNKKFNNPFNNKIEKEFSHSEKCKDSDLVILSPGIDPQKNKIIKILSDLNIPIISEIEFASWFTNSPIIAITGSNGKSTVVKMLHEILQEKYENVLLGGNIGISFSSNVVDELKSELINSVHLLEVSSFQLENIKTFKPYISCILNVTKDHLDRHGDFNNYLNQKMKITKNHDSNSFVVYNEDDDNLKSIFKEKINSLPFSIQKKNQFFTKKKTIFYSKTNEKIIYQNKTNLLGEHNLSNILACLNISEILNINKKQLVNSLINFKPLKHRMEVVYKKNSFMIINDSKSTNLDSTNSAVKSFKNEIILLFGGFSKNELDKDEIINITKYKNISEIICFGQIGKQIYEILKKKTKSVLIQNFNDAILKSIELSLNKKTIVFSPGFKSFDEFKNFEERGEHFKKIIKSYFV